MGLSRFYLVDEDILLPENICRHALDWSSIGQHKVDATADALGRLRAEIEVDVSRLHLTGQESNASLAGTLRRLGRCDLIIDATANPRVFNLLAVAATSGARPLVWLEVYAGGIGGMVARWRPGRDADPHRLRAAYHGFTAENPAPDLAIGEDYRAETPEGVILAASDADVAVIAAHAARLAADAVLGVEPSLFPHPIYLVGLRRGWVFSEPFHTIPIDVEATPNEDQSPVDVEQAEILQFLNELIRNHGDANLPS
jgi:molybdopterin/thiamine biosynthesis adenylyltransferase